MYTIMQQCIHTVSALGARNSHGNYCSSAPWLLMTPASSHALILACCATWGAKVQVLVILIWYLRLYNSSHVEYLSPHAEQRCKKKNTFIMLFHLLSLISNVYFYCHFISFLCYGFMRSKRHKLSIPVVFHFLDSCVPNRPIVCIRIKKVKHYKLWLFVKIYVCLMRKRCINTLHTAQESSRAVD